MEVHFVHSNSFSELTVLAVFVDAPDDDSECSFLNQLISELPETETEENEVDISNLINFDDDTDYFVFSGSLTTPPCTEGVNWVVRAEPIRCSESQVQEFQSIIGVSNRPVQSKNSRVVTFGNDNTDNSFSSNTSNTSNDDDDDSSNTSNSSNDDDDSSSSGSILTVGFLAFVATLALF